MEINGQKFFVKETYDRVITVPDCFVVRANKLGHGNGEAKLYIGSKDVMAAFFSNGETFAQIPCFLLKSDLLKYLEAVKTEYFEPSVTYATTDPHALKKLWTERWNLVNSLPEVIEFKIDDQDQIAGPRGYIKSKDYGYQLIRELSLPIITYMSVMEVVDNKGCRLFYFKLFVDYEAVKNLVNGPLVFNYGTKDCSTQNKTAPKKTQSNSNSRDGQAKYREQLLLQCPYCPITMVNDERLLIASHIKPWAVCNEKERVDPKNGYMLTPLYDKLFDRGFITFDQQRNMIVSDWLSPLNKQRLGLTKSIFVQRLPIDDDREKYLQYHRQFVFQGKL